MLLDGLLPPAVAIAQADLSHAPGPLLGAEAAAMEGAVAGRRTEFAAGRTCARKALALLGHPPVSIPVADDRLPLWPPGITGSISHNQIFCIAAVAYTTSEVQALGVDIERVDAVDLDLVDTICTQREKDWLAGHPAGLRRTLLTGIFTAKESVYKAQYSISRSMFGFDTISINLSLERGTFLASFEHAVPPFSCNQTASGRIEMRHDHWVAAVAIPSNSYLVGEAICVISRENNRISGTTA